MLGLRYLKAPPTQHILHYRGGRLVRQGSGLAFFYFAPTSVLAKVPVSSVDQPFIFPGVTRDFQEVTVQGVLTYRIAEPEKVARLFDYTIDARGRYTTDDPSKLGERLVQVAQAAGRSFVQPLPMREVLLATGPLVKAIRQALTESPTVTSLGVEIMEVLVTAIRSDPEMSKALQQPTREQLLHEADEAIYARRSASVELERNIRERELETEIFVARKQQEVSEAEMAGRIAVERQRTDLVDSRVANERKEAEARGEALRAVLAPAKEVDWRLLMALTGRTEPGTFVASAFDQLAANAERIGQLNITPDLLKELLDRDSS